MANLEKQFRKMPKARMSLRGRIRLRKNLYIMQFKGAIEALGYKKFHLKTVSVFVFFVFVFGLPFYSYASPGVNSGHILYPVKKVIEKVELRMAVDEEERAEKYEKFTEKRLHEAELISRSIKNDKDRDSLTKSIQEAISLKEESRSLYNQDKEEDAKKREKNDNRQKEKLVEIAREVGVGEKDKLVETVALAIENIVNKEKNKSSSFNNTEKKASSSKESARKENKVLQKKEQEEKDVSGKSDFNENREKNNNRGKFGSDKNEKEPDDLSELKGSINKLKKDLEDEDYEKNDLENLFNKLNRGAEKADRAVKEKKEKDAEAIINSTKAISNNAKYFIKTKEDKKNESEKRGNSGKSRGGGAGKK